MMSLKMNEFCLLLGLFAVANDERRTKIGCPLPDGPIGYRSQAHTPQAMGTAGAMFPISTCLIWSHTPHF